MSEERFLYAGYIRRRAENMSKTKLEKAKGREIIASTSYSLTPSIWAQQREMLLIEQIPFKLNQTIFMQNFILPILVSLFRKAGVGWG